MPVLLLRVDYDDVPWIEEKVGALTIDHETLACQTEKNLDVIMFVPIRSGSRPKSHTIKTNRLFVVWP